MQEPNKPSPAAGALQIQNQNYLRSKAKANVPLNRNFNRDVHSGPTTPIVGSPPGQRFQGAPVGFTSPANVPFRPSSFPQQAHQSTVNPSFTYVQDVPMSWDWRGAVDYTGGVYEPQGELQQDQQQAQGFVPQDFNIPYPIQTGEPSSYQSPQNFPSASSTPTVQRPPSPRKPAFPALPSADSIQTGMKRKADASEPVSASSSTMTTTFPTDQQPPSKMSKSRTPSHTGGPLTPAPQAKQSEGRPSTSRTQTQDITSPTPDAGTEEPEVEVSSRKTSTQSNGREKSVSSSKGRRIMDVSGMLGVLPAGKVFPIQIGSELFRLSGASISSDAPSYFSHFFGDQLSGGPSKAGELKTLYIDRDPGVFKDIALHLQGYYVRPRDSEHFVKLFADAQFYSLPRLTQQLFKSEIFVEIGGRDFRIPRDLFSNPGDSPNFFSLGFAHFFSTPSEAFPGLDRTTLLRPPSILPPAVHNRSGEIFAELMRLLQGYPVQVRDEQHRAELLRDARYFHLKGLEQKILPHEISFNILRNTSEIVMRLEDIRQSGVSYRPDTDAANDMNDLQIRGPAQSPGGPATGPGFVSYARPYTDEESHILVLEIGAPESTRLHLSVGTAMNTMFVRATFQNQTLARISSLFQVVANKMGLPATQPLGLMMMESGGGVAAQPVSPANSGVSEERVKVRIDDDAYITLDGAQVTVDPEAKSRSWATPRLLKQKRNRRSEKEAELEDAVDWDEDEEVSWIVRRAHWRLRMVPGEELGRMEVVMCAVRLELFTNELNRNQARGFLRE